MAKHPDYWFDDGSVLIVVQTTAYKLHRSLITRLSARFFDDCCEITNVEKEISGVLSPDQCFAVRSEKKVTKQDLDALIGYILHDITLTDEASFAHLLRVYNVSSESKLDFRKIHLAVEKYLSLFMQKNPLKIDYSDYNLLEVALNISKDSNNCKLLSLLRRALYYSYATHNNVTFGDTEVPDSNPESKHIIGPDAILCERIMSQLSDQLSPTLFQPPAALHMQCTDVYASLWMERAVQPAFADSGTANPFMTLQRLRLVDWRRETEGLDGERSEPCSECLEHMREQWKGDAQTIWEMMDSWISN